MILSGILMNCSKDVVVFALDVAHPDLPQTIEQASSRVFMEKCLKGLMASVAATMISFVSKLNPQSSEIFAFETEFKKFASLKDIEMKLSHHFGRVLERIAPPVVEKPVARAPPKTPPRSFAVQTSLPSSPDSAFRKRRREETDSESLAAQAAQVYPVDAALLTKPTNAFATNI